MDGIQPENKRCHNCNELMITLDKESPLNLYPYKDYPLLYDRSYYCTRCKGFLSFMEEYN